MLVDSFEYYEFDGIGEVFAGSDKFKEPVTVKNVKIDYQSTYTRDTTEADVRPSAIIFCYTSDTRPFLDFKSRSKVIINGTEAIIHRVLPYNEPHRNELWSIELEVI